jgi:tRNA nucleotidyltransferase (CCA-adding enzyme)
MREEVDARNGMLTVAFERPELVDDILYPQLRKLLRRTRQVLQEHEFELFESDVFVGDDEIRLVLDLKVAELPPRSKHQGPWVFNDREHMANFMSKYDRVWVEDGRLTTIVEREYEEAECLLEEFFSGDLREKGVPKDLVAVVADRRIGEPVFEDEEWLRFMMEFLCLASRVPRGQVS